MYVSAVTGQGVWYDCHYYAGGVCD